MRGAYFLHGCEHACRVTFKGSLNKGVEGTKTPGGEPNSSSGAKVREEK